MLQTILGLERLDRLTAFAAELAEGVPSASSSRLTPSSSEVAASTAWAFGGTATDHDSSTHLSSSAGWGDGEEEDERRSVTGPCPPSLPAGRPAGSSRGGSLEATSDGAAPAQQQQQEQQEQQDERQDLRQDHRQPASESPHDQALIGFQCQGTPPADQQQQRASGPGPESRPGSQETVGGSIPATPFYTPVSAAVGPMSSPYTHGQGYPTQQQEQQRWQQQGAGLPSAGGQRALPLPAAETAAAAAAGADRIVSIKRALADSLTQVSGRSSIRGGGSISGDSSAPGPQRQQQQQQVPDAAGGASAATDSSDILQNGHAHMQDGSSGAPSSSSTPPQDQQTREQQLGRGWRTSDEGASDQGGYQTAASTPASTPGAPLPVEAAEPVGSPVLPLPDVARGSSGGGGGAKPPLPPGQPASQPPSANKLEVLTTTTNGPSASAGSAAAAAAAMVRPDATPRRDLLGATPLGSRSSSRQVAGSAATSAAGTPLSSAQGSPTRKASPEKLPLQQEQEVVRVTASGIDLSKPMHAADLLAVYHGSVVPQPGQVSNLQFALLGGR